MGKQGTRILIRARRQPDLMTVASSPCGKPLPSCSSLPFQSLGLRFCRTITLSGSASCPYSMALLVLILLAFCFIPPSSISYFNTPVQPDLLWLMFPGWAAVLPCSLRLLRHPLRPLQDDVLPQTGFERPLRRIRFDPVKALHRLLTRLAVDRSHRHLVTQAHPGTFFPAVV